MRLVVRGTWRIWMRIARRLPPGPRREGYLGYYGPLILLLLLATWAAGLVVGFALVHWGLGSQLLDPGHPVAFLSDLYMSGTTFFTLGLGEVTPRTWSVRFVTVAQPGPRTRSWTQFACIVWFGAFFVA